MPRCDLCGPYTPSQAAMIVRGEWTPQRTGFLCPNCQQAVQMAARSIAADIDRKAADAVLKEFHLA